MRHCLFLRRNKLIDFKMSSLANAIVDRSIGSSSVNVNPASIIPKLMLDLIEEEKNNLKQISNNFLPRYFDYRTRDQRNKLHVIQLMSEYEGNFSTPICYLQFYMKHAAKFIRFAESLGKLSGIEEINRINCLKIYKDFIQRYTDLINAIQTHEQDCDGRLFRRSVERMRPDIAHVPINLRLQQLLVSNGDDPSQKSIYNIVTLGAPAVHHSRFTHGGLERIKANLNETNKRLCYLQEKLQNILILNSDIHDALDHLSHIIESPSTYIEYSVLKLSLQRVIKNIFLLLEYSNKDHDVICNSTERILIDLTLPKISTDETVETIHIKAKKFLEEIKQSMDKNEQNFNRIELNNLRLIAEELENSTCKHIMRYIFQESMDIERYPQIFRERFDIAFSQALTCLIFSINVQLSSVKINDRAWRLYINNGECRRV